MCRSGRHTECAYYFFGKVGVMAKAKRVRCPCGGWVGCQLCQGRKFYEYTPGPRGWLPFRCPTCKGEKLTTVDGQPDQRCPTCQGEGMIDPAQPPGGGWLDTIFKIFFGA